MSFRNLFTKKATEVAETVITQTKETLQKKAENKVVLKGNAAYTLGKLALLGLIFVIAGKEAFGNDTSESEKQQNHPTSIVINNYLNERSANHD